MQCVDCHLDFIILLVCVQILGNSLNIYAAALHLEAEGIIQLQISCNCYRNEKQQILAQINPVISYHT